MRRGYLHSPVPREEQADKRHQIRFCRFAKDAGRWTTRESAEIDQNYLNKVGIEIPSVKGGTYTIRDFEVEELGPDHYVIFADAPFIVREGVEPMGNRVGNG
jgi:hypothetical protein